MNARRSPLIPWLHLLRLPNLFTVPGDPLAGFFLAGASASPVSALLAGAAALCFYACGLVLNDMVDMEEDLRDRPARPLPSGQITPKQAGAAAAATAAAGLACSAAAGVSAGMVGAVLLGLVVVYNVRAKQSDLFGPFVMGLCRAGSLMLGASAASSTWWSLPQVWAGAAVVGVYIWIVSLLARNETRGGVISPPVIGHLIRGICFLQAILIFAGGGAGTAAGLTALMWLPSFLLGRRIPAS